MQYVLRFLFCTARAESGCATGRAAGHLVVGLAKIEDGAGGVERAYRRAQSFLARASTAVSAVGPTTRTSPVCSFSHSGTPSRHPQTPPHRARRAPRAPKLAATMAEQEGRKPRLVITDMVLENFKSYAGAQRVGPFHKVRPRRAAPPDAPKPAARAAAAHAAAPPAVLLLGRRPQRLRQIERHRRDALCLREAREAAAPLQGLGAHPQLDAPPGPRDGQGLGPLPGDCRWGASLCRVAGRCC
jgi:hypothetical protein